MKKISLLCAILALQSFTLNGCLSRIFCCTQRMPYERALLKWQHLFNRNVVNDSVNSKDIMDARFGSAKEVLHAFPALINTKSLSDDTPLTFIAFLRARPKSPEDRYWNPIITYFQQKAARKI